MTKTMPRTGYRCERCGADVAKWVGRCPECEAWGSVAERPRPVAPGSRPAQPMALQAVPHAGLAPTPTGAPELDRVLGGGLAPGSVTLVGGEPGIGKSTLLLQALVGLAGSGVACLLVSAEESAGQVRARAQRLGDVPEGLSVLATSSLPDVHDAVARGRPACLVVDSVQTMADPETPGLPGSVAQVRECAQQLVRLAKAHDVAVVLVGHVTKEGDLAGPRVLEHLVDTVVSFEGDRHHALRLLRVLKHRFGPTLELGVLEMGTEGLSAVADPSGLFLADRQPGVPGSVVAPVVEGGRPLLVEVQGLTVQSSGPVPRRTGQGYDAGRLGMLLAVLDRRGGVGLRSSEVYVSVAGGVRITEPGADLAVAVALAGTTSGSPVDERTVVLGELGLAGEVRRVPQVERRLVEAARLGFTTAIVPRGAPPVPGLEPVPVATLGDALTAAGVA